MHDARRPAVALNYGDRQLQRARLEQLGELGIGRARGKSRRIAPPSGSAELPRTSRASRSPDWPPVGLDDKRVPRSARPSRSSAVPISISLRASAGGMTRRALITRPRSTSWVNDAT
jgi:hypothetical protein